MKGQARFDLASLCERRTSFKTTGVANTERDGKRAERDLERLKKLGLEITKSDTTLKNAGL